jgi:hypothetical protein
MEVREFQAVRYGGGSGKLDQATEPLRRSNIRGSAGAEVPPNKRKEP